MVRDFGAKLRITAAALGCGSQKDLRARFREANPRTTLELERSYKWVQGRVLPRSAQVYEDWAKLLGTGRPLAWLQSCTCGRRRAGAARPAARPPFRRGLCLLPPRLLLEGFLRGDHTRDYIKVDAGEYSRLALAFDRLFIEHDLAAGVRPLPLRARRSSRDRVQLVQG
jgi:hypothetical protein